MESLIKSTDWIMAEVKPYSLFHLVFFATGIICILIITNTTSKFDQKKSDMFLFCLGIFLLMTEVYKQLFYYYVITPYDYSWWIFPFQMCSIPMYLTIIQYFVKDERIKTCLFDYIFSFALFGGLAAFIEPSGIIHEYWTLTLHSFIWHLVLILMSIHIFRNNNISFKSFKNPLLLFLVLLVIALAINFFVVSITGEYINMFFAGPEVSTIILFDKISEKFGWLLNDMLFFPIIIALVYTMRRILLKLRKRTFKQVRLD